MAPFLLCEDFIVYLEVEKRFSRHTLEAYKTDLLQFFQFAELKEVEDVLEVRSSLVRSWIVQLMDSKVSSRSINRKLSSLRSFFKWLKKCRNISSNAMLKVAGPKSSKRLPEFAKESELNSGVLEFCFSDDFDGRRDKLMFELFYQTGMRLSELIGLEAGDVSNGSIRIFGKRNKERIVPISDRLIELVASYLDAREAIVSKDNHLFLLNNGKKLYPKFVYRRINYYLSTVTSLDKCSPHVLRHTFATHMLNRGAGLETLKDLLGHSNLSATQIYTHNSFAQLNAIYSQAHPRGH